MRNKLIHEYFGVSPVTIYATIHSARSSGVKKAIIAFDIVTLE